MRINYTINNVYIINSRRVDSIINNIMSMSADKSKIMSETLNLKQLMDNPDDYVDNTKYIRDVKHSECIYIDICKIERLKAELFELRKESPDIFKDKLKIECSFLYTYYPDIFNRLCRDELNINIMSKLIQILKLIEDGLVDQHEGSVAVGKLLKELYVDSALKTSDNINKQYNAEPSPKVEFKHISWREYKTVHL